MGEFREIILAFCRADRGSVDNADEGGAITFITKNCRSVKKAIKKATKKAAPKKKGGRISKEKKAAGAKRAAAMKKAVRARERSRQVEQLWWVNNMTQYAVSAFEIVVPRACSAQAERTGTHGFSVDCACNCGFSVDCRLQHMR